MSRPRARRSGTIVGAPRCLGHPCVYGSGRREGVDQTSDHCDDPLGISGVGSAHQVEGGLGQRAIDDRRERLGIGGAVEMAGFLQHPQAEQGRRSTERRIKLTQLFLVEHARGVDGNEPGPPRIRGELEASPAASEEHRHRIPLGERGLADLVIERGDLLDQHCLEQRPLVREVVEQRTLRTAGVLRYLGGTRGVEPAANEQRPSAGDDGGSSLSGSFGGSASHGDRDFTEWYSVNMVAARLSSRIIGDIGPAEARRPRTRPIRGRQAERAALDRLCRGLVDNTDETVLVIEGDAGMGKTRLIQELCDLAAGSGIAPAVAMCDPIAHDRPFGPLLEALGCDRSSTDDRRRAVAAGAASLGGRAAAMEQLPSQMAGLDLGARYGVQDDLVELLLDEADTAPVVLAIDDAQWIDAATASTLSALVRRRGRRPIAVVLAMRPAPRPTELQTLLDRWGGEAQLLRLDPLGSDVVAELAADLLGDRPPDELRRDLARAGGNAFSVVQLTRAFASQGTTNLDGVRASVIARSQAVGPDATALLTMAAVLGTDFTPDDLGLLSGRDAYEVFDILHGAARTGLLVSQGHGFAFSHDLVAEAFVAETPEPLRVAIHRTVVRRAGELRVTPSVLAHHVMAAAIPDDIESIDSLCRAAADVGNHDPHLALTFLDHAQALCGPTCIRQVEVAIRRAAAMCVLHRVVDAIEVLRVALEHAQTTSAIGQLRSARARCLHLLGDVVGASDEFERLASSGILGPAEEAAAWADVATYRLWAMQGLHPWNEAQRAVELADECGVVAPAVQALAAQSAMAALRGELDLGLELGERACRRGLALPHHVVIPAPTFSLGIARMLADDLDGAVRALQGERLRIEQLGDPLLAIRPATALVIALFLAGAWDDALAESESILGACDDTGTGVGRLTARTLTGLIAHYRCNDEAAEDALEQALGITGVTDGYSVPFLLQLQALRMERAGAIEAASSLMADTAALAASLAPAIRPWFALDAVRLAVAKGDVSTALVDGLVEQAAPLGRPGPLGMARIASGVARGDAEAIRTGLLEVHSSPQPLNRSLALELAGTALAAHGAGGDGHAAMSAARTGYESLAATHLIGRIGSILAPHRVARPQRPRFGWDSLTPAELSVVRLLAAGARNAEIASELVLSKRTVESHVSSMLVKLGVGTRVELANVANRHGSGTAAAG